MKSAPVMPATCSRPTFLYMLRPCVAWAPRPPFNFLASVVFFWPSFQSQRVEKPASTPTVLPHVEHICLEGCLMYGLFIFFPLLFFFFFLFLPWHFFFARSFTSAFAPKKKKKNGKPRGEMRETALKMLVSRQQVESRRAAFVPRLGPPAQYFFSYVNFWPSPANTSLKRRRRHHQTLLLTRPRAFDGKLKANSPKVALYLRLAQIELIKWQQQIIASRLSGSYLWLARGISE